MAADDTVERCVGCMAAPANVKLTKACDSPECGSCMCRPMWCLACLGKWFASRQPQSFPERWLAGHGECPTCRQKFCVRDILRLEQQRS